MTSIVVIQNNFEWHVQCLAQCLCSLMAFPPEKRRVIKVVPYGLFHIFKYEPVSKRICGTVHQNKEGAPYCCYQSAFAVARWINIAAGHETVHYGHWTVASNKYQKNDHNHVCFVFSLL